MKSLQCQRIPARILPGNVLFFSPRLQKLAISYDQTIVESLLAIRTEQSFDQARRVYSEGGNSKTIATLTLAGGLGVNIAKGTKLTAKGFDGRDVVGFSENSAVVGATTIQFRYPTTDNMQNHLDCRVGGLPAPEQILAGCKPPQTAEQYESLHVDDWVTSSFCPFINTQVLYHRVFLQLTG